MKHLLRAMGAAMLAALLLSACSTPQEQTEPSAPQTTQATQAATGATEESATEAEELLALPRDLGSGLTLQAVLPFSGPNVDADGAESDQLATIIVQNDGGMAVGAADITLTCEDGAELRFRVTDLPVGGSCYAFELNSAQYTGENRVCAASAEVEPDGSLSVDYRVSVMVQDGGLVLVNMTEDTLAQRHRPLPHGHRRHLLRRPELHSHGRGAGPRRVADGPRGGMLHGSALRHRGLGRRIVITLEKGGNIDEKTEQNAPLAAVDRGDARIVRRSPGGGGGTGRRAADRGCAGG